MRVCAVAGDAQGPSSELWRDETLPFGLSVISDEGRYSKLLKAVTAAEDASKFTRKRIYAFASRYLPDRADSAPDKDNIGRLSEELSPNLVDFWCALGPQGERIACDGYDETRWSGLLTEAAENTVRRAIDRLPPNARRYRAEFMRATRQKK